MYGATYPVAKLTEPQDGENVVANMKPGELRITDFGLRTVKHCGNGPLYVNRRVRRRSPAITTRDPRLPDCPSEGGQARFGYHSP